MSDPAFPMIPNVFHATSVPSTNEAAVSNASSGSLSTQKKSCEWVEGRGCKPTLSMHRIRRLQGSDLHLVNEEEEEKNCQYEKVVCDKCLDDPDCDSHNSESSRELAEGLSQPDGPLLWSEIHSSSRLLSLSFPLPSLVNRASECARRFDLAFLYEERGRRKQKEEGLLSECIQRWTSGMDPELSPACGRGARTPHAGETAAPLPFSAVLPSF